MSFREPSFNGWGAVLDTESLREFPPPPLPGQELLNVPAKSLVFITYPWLIEAVPPIQLLSVTEIPPYNADIIMLPLSHNQIDCQLKESGFSHCIHVSPIAVEFKVPKSLYQTTKNAALRIGMRGRAEGSLWTATFGDGCYSEDTVKTTNQLQTTFRVWRHDYRLWGLGLLTSASVCRCPFLVLVHTLKLDWIVCPQPTNQELYTSSFLLTLCGRFG